MNARREVADYQSRSGADGVNNGENSGFSGAADAAARVCGGILAMGGKGGRIGRVVRDVPRR